MLGCGCARRDRPQSRQTESDPVLGSGLDDGSAIPTGWADRESRERRIAQEIQQQRFTQQQAIETKTTAAITCDGQKQIPLWILQMPPVSVEKFGQVVNRQRSFCRKMGRNLFGKIGQRLCKRNAAIARMTRDNSAHGTSWFDQRIEPVRIVPKLQRDIKKGGLTATDKAQTTSLFFTGSAQTQQLCGARQPVAYPQQFLITDQVIAQLYVAQSFRDGFWTLRSTSCGLCPGWIWTVSVAPRWLCAYCFSSMQADY